MSKNKELTIIDIGSHKLEEIFILFNPGIDQFLIYAKWLLLRVIMAIKKLDFFRLLRIRKQFEIFKYYFIDKRSYNIKIISIEPNINVSYKFVKRLSKKFPVHYIPAAILGHDSSNIIGLKKLFFYDHTTSSSIYIKDRSIDEGKSKICVAIKFGILWDELVKENIIEESTPFLLRMNCEGAELGVIEDCRKKKLKPICIIGSLGDIGKIHGKNANSRSESILEEMNIPYFYFKGADPSTWHEMIDIWENYVSKDFKTN